MYDTAAQRRLLLSRAGYEHQLGLDFRAEADLARLLERVSPQEEAVQREGLLLAAEIACDRGDPARAEAHLALALARAIAPEPVQDRVDRLRERWRCGSSPTAASPDAP